MKMPLPAICHRNIIYLVVRQEESLSLISYSTPQPLPIPQPKPVAIQIQNHKNNKHILKLSRLKE